jgi:RsiW-degrading membrane proteinase PrsW (M82 family)
MPADGLPWLAFCFAVGAAWTLATSWRVGGKRLAAALRAALGGCAALWTSSGLYGLLQLAGLEIHWSSIESGAWPALGFALLVGVVEEAGKLAGFALAAPPPAEGPGGVLRAAAGVAAVFAVGEAAVTMRGALWHVALGRAALGPVAHALLAAPLAVVLADLSRRSERRFALRLAVAFATAAALHGLGDWSIARPVWGRVGFAAALLAPALWLYARARLGVPARAFARASGRR